MLATATVLTMSLGACSPRRASSAMFHPLDVDSGWHRTMPLVFAPQYGDSNARYDITLAIRHTNLYDYSNLCVTADIVSDNATPVRRIPVEFTLSDGNGNWRGAGFGALYQATQRIATGVTPTEAHRVVMWQTMTNAPTVNQLPEVGIIVEPSH
ncbi:MAG: hypothetical protein IKR25_11190 [Muribaculaceae bacterium]|nr:hypothetical protein [Muribaculaceae bacterium]